MVLITINIELTAENEAEIKDRLKYFPLDTPIIVNGEKMLLEDLFDYEHSKVK